MGAALSLAVVCELLIVAASLAVEPWLHRVQGSVAGSVSAAWGSTAQAHESSWTRDQIHVPCIGRWILNHWTTREVPLQILEQQRAPSCIYCNYMWPPLKHIRLK